MLFCFLGKLGNSNLSKDLVFSTTFSLVLKGNNSHLRVSVERTEQAV